MYYDDIFDIIDTQVKNVYDILDFYTKKYNKFLKAAPKPAYEKKSVSATTAAKQNNCDRCNREINTSKDIFKLSPPWITIERKLRAMFAGDEEITFKPMTRNDGICTLVIESSSATKIDALSKILKTTYKFGNVTLKIKFAVTNNNKDNDEYYDTDNIYDVWLESLASTPAVVDIITTENLVGDRFVVVEFKKEVIQFFNDDLTDYYGNWNGLYTDLAKEIFKYDARIKFTIEK